MWPESGEKREDNSSGRVGAGSEWLFYDTFILRAIGEEEERHFPAR